MVMNQNNVLARKSKLVTCNVRAISCELSHAAGRSLHSAKLCKLQVEAFHHRPGDESSSPQGTSEACKQFFLQFYERLDSV
ncbi:MAG: hypothetical protein DMG23_03165 [Acidobacteria bacterium]|nr:MAG: hypothetical protein DMG23_03165 [Acidobacteriota bacterium]